MSLDIRQETDRVRSRGLWAGGGVVAITIAVSITVVVLLMLQAGLRPGTLQAGEEHIHSAPPEDLAAESTLYGRATPAERAAARATDRLRTTGWVDRAAGRVHLPIDLAIEAYLARQGGRAP